MAHTTTTCSELGCKAAATTLVAWTNFSNLSRESLYCTKDAQAFVALPSVAPRVRYAVALHPTTRRQAEHRAAWLGWDEETIRVYNEAAD